MSKIPPPPVVKKAITTPAKTKHKHEIVMPSKNARVKTATFRVYNLYIRTQGASVEWCWMNALVTEDPDGPKAKDWISLEAVRDNATREGWKTERDKMWADVRKQVASAAKIEIVEAELGEMEVLTKIQEGLKTAITGPDLHPATLEGGIRAYIALDKRIGEKRGFVAERVTSLAPPPPPGEAGPASLVAPDVADSLEEEEMRKFAIDVTTARAGMNTGQAMKAIEQQTSGVNGVEDAEHDHGEE